MDEEYDVIWIKDQEVENCMNCRQLFSIMKRRHHCRSCGCVVCSNCSPTRKPVYGLVGLQRVCTECLSNGVWIDPVEKAKQTKPPVDGIGLIYTSLDILMKRRRTST